MTAARHHFAPLLVLVATLAGGLLAAPAGAQQSYLATERVASGLDAPVLVTQPQGESSKLFVVEQPGVVEIVEDGIVAPTPLLDIQGLVDISNPLFGLAALVFHPDYMTNGWFYVQYKTHTPSLVLVRYTVPDPATYQVDYDSALVLLEVSAGNAPHQGGGLAFGPDGKLYVAIGDERVGCSAQDGQSLYGKVMRLEDDGSIPVDNPFVGDPTVRDEIFVLGLRNPWRMSFDPLTGDLYIGDVGEDAAEEINLVPAGTGGQNFGWKVVEGEQCYVAGGGCTLPCPDPTADYVAPIWQYQHGITGCCVIGGHVYRGAAIPQLQGKFLFADYCRADLWTLTWDGAAVTGFADVTDDLRPDLGLGLDSIVSFGTDAAGELYIVDNAGQDLGQGEVFKVIPGDAFIGGGHALAGTYGEPQLQGSGTLVPGAPIQLSMSGALEHTVAYFVYGFFELNLPFYGGTLVPDFFPPGNFVVLPTGPTGAITITDSWPAGAPSGLTLYFQYWFVDGAGIHGYSASNAIGAIVP